MNIKQMLASSPVRLALAFALAAVVLAGALQLTPGCRHWRNWNASQDGQRYITLELFSKPAYCFDL